MVCLLNFLLCETPYVMVSLSQQHVELHNIGHSISKQTHKQYGHYLLIKRTLSVKKIKTVFMVDINLNNLNILVFQIRKKPMYQLSAVEQNHHRISSFLTHLLKKKAESLHRDPGEMQIYTL